MNLPAINQPMWAMLREVKFDAQSKQVR